MIFKQAGFLVSSLFCHSYVSFELWIFQLFLTNVLEIYHTIDVVAPCNDGAHGVKRQERNQKQEMHRQRDTLMSTKSDQEINAIID